MLSVVMLNVIVLLVIGKPLMLSVTCKLFMVTSVILNVIMVSVVAPFLPHKILSVIVFAIFYRVTFP